MFHGPPAEFPGRIDPNESFRERRRQSRRRRRNRRLLAAVVLAGAAAALAVGARSIGDGDNPSGLAPPAQAPVAAPAELVQPSGPAEPGPQELPAEVRGVHVTMSLASLEGKIEEYLALTRYGLNTLEVDVKDESGRVAFRWPAVPLARMIGAARPYYKAPDVAARARESDVYLIGRVVVFEDPVLAQGRPELAIRRPDGSVWTDRVGLGWTNPYDEDVWDYNVDVAEAAARAGFDEIMFDYVRFPSDGSLSEIVYPGRLPEAKARTIARFLEYARGRLHPLGVRVSAAVFGLAATRNIGVGQKPRLMSRHLDAVYAMVYPSHYRPGEYGLREPAAVPGITVGYSLRDFRRALRGRSTKLIPWLQDFSLGRTYGPADVLDQVAAARRRGTAGFLLWNAEGIYTPEALAAAP